MTIAEKIDLNNQVVPLLPTLGPVGKLASVGLAIPGQWLGLQHKLQDVTANAVEMGMKVNHEKTKAISFNMTKTYQAIPMISATEGQSLMLVQELRLLGILFDHELTWWPMVRDICSRSRAKIWSLLRLREAGAELQILTASYCMRVRTILEYAVPVWGGLLNGQQALVLEEVQRLACLVMLGGQASSYAQNLSKLELPRLSTRREELTRNFTIGCYKSSKHRWWFKPTTVPTRPTRHTPPRFQVPDFNTLGSPFHVYTNILNSITDTKWSELNLPLPTESEFKKNLQLNGMYCDKQIGLNQLLVHPLHTEAVQVQAHGHNGTQTHLQVVVAQEPITINH